MDKTFALLVDLGDGTNKHLWLSTLAVDPKFQRRSVGRRLLRWGIRQADREGVPCGLCASPVGLGLYEREGFRKIETIVYGPIEDPMMVRWPDGGEKPGFEKEVEAEEGEDR